MWSTTDSDTCRGHGANDGPGVTWNATPSCLHSRTTRSSLGTSQREEGPRIITKLSTMGTSYSISQCSVADESNHILTFSRRLDPGIARQLVDKMYEKRKAAALDLEK